MYYGKSSVQGVHGNSVDHNLTEGECKSALFHRRKLAEKEHPEIHRLERMRLERPPERERGRCTSDAGRNK